jgi:large subunit ribosomal protein L33
MLATLSGFAADLDNERERAKVRAISGEQTMAKQTTVMIKLVSTADTGYYYVTKKNPRTSTKKFEFRKYDPIVRKHVAFKEAKIK